MTGQPSQKLFTYGMLLLFIGFLCGAVLAPAITGWASKQVNRDVSGPFLVKASNQELGGPSSRNANHCIGNDADSHRFCCISWGDWKVRQCEQSGGNVCEIVDTTRDFGSCTTIIPERRTDSANEII